MKKYEIVVSLSLFLYGAYLATPLYVLSEPATLSGGTTELQIRLAGIVYMAGALPSLIGLAIKHEDLRRAGILVTGCTWIFAAMLRISAVGVHSALWAFMIVMAIIAFLVRLDITTGRGTK